MSVTTPFVLKMLLVVNAVLLAVLLVALFDHWYEPDSATTSQQSALWSPSLVAAATPDAPTDDAADRVVPGNLPAVQRAASNKQQRQPKAAVAPVATNEEQAPPPKKQPQPDGPIIRVTAWVGEPYGIGRMNVLLNADDAPRWRPDRLVFLQEATGRTRHPVIRMVETDAAKGAAQLAEVDVYFLFNGQEPLDLTLTAADTRLAHIVSVRQAIDRLEYRQLLNTWWEGFQEDLSNATGNQFLVRSYWARMLARRMKLPLAASRPSVDEDQGTTEIERQFERIVSTLFGIDSVLLAMPDHELGRKQVQLASQPLPPPMQLRSVVVPGTARQTAIESIAFRAPHDCYYLRCRNLNNYLWLRDFLMQWGGSLHEVVSARTIDFDIRDTIERQLAISAEAIVELGAEKAIADIAIIGTDLLFRDGAGVGVLIEAKDNALLSDIIRQQREKQRQTVPDTQHSNVQIADRDVSLLWSPGNIVRSYYVVDDNFHLVTNSLDIATKFLQTGRGRGGLGHLREFQYARSKDPLPLQQRVWLYVSDPFFRRVVSPQYRIEIGRRAQALAELQELRLAALTAASEGVNDGAGDTTVAALRDRGFLSDDFAFRADESHAILRGKVAIDSLRGRPGTFKPIADMTISRASPSEVVDYNEFRRRYGRQWRVVDPVVVSIASAASGQAGRQRVSMRVMVTPYARERYALLTSVLGPVSSSRIAMLPEDLLSLEAGLRSGSRTYQAHVGLHDAEVSFQIADGEVVRQRPYEHTKFARRNLYAVVNPSGTAGLGLLGRFADSLADSANSNSSFENLSPDQPPSPDDNIAESFLVAGLRAVFGDLLVKPLKLLIRSSAVKHEGRWSMVSRNAELLDSVPSRLRFDERARRTQVRFRMRDVNSAAVAPYVHAYSFLEARKSSAANANLLNLLHQQLHVPVENARSAAEEALRATLVCPLDGTYELAGTHWRSSVWETDSYFDVQAAPPDFRHPFLNWLRGLDVAFELSASTLSANIDMEVLGNGDGRWETDFVAIDENESRALPPHTVLKAATPRQEKIRPLSDNSRLRAGDTVVVTDARATLRLGRTNLAVLEVGERLRVLETQRPWIGVQREKDQHVQRAWVLQSQLGTVEQAGEE